MSVKTISTDILRQMKDTEGLVIQGCGGDLNEWVEGINDLLTKAEVLLDGTRFNCCSAFSHRGTTCLLFPFTEEVHLDIRRLAMWRFQTRSYFGGTWLSDFVPNQLGGFMDKRLKPDCPLIGEDGNIFHLVGVAAKTLRSNGMEEEAEQMCRRVYTSGSYDEALGVIGEYVNITSAEESFDEEMVLS